MADSLEELLSADLVDAAIVREHVKATNAVIPAPLRAKAWLAMLGVDDKPDHVSHRDVVSQPDDLQAEVQAVADRFLDTDETLPPLELAKLVALYCEARGITYSPRDGLAELLLPFVALGLPLGDCYNAYYAMLGKFALKQLDDNAPCYDVFRLLLLYHEPEVCSMLDSMRLSLASFLRVWMRSLLVATCAADVVLPLWDLFLARDDPFLIFYLALVLVINAKDAISSMTDQPEQVLEFLTAMPTNITADDVVDMVELAVHYSTRTPAAIRQLYLNLLFGTGRRLADEEQIDPSKALCCHMTVEAIVDRSQAQQLFLVDTRPLDQYDDGHFINTQWHLDAKLMMDSPDAFEREMTKMQLALATNEKHICFLGHDGKDDLEAMVVAKVLTKQIKHVSIVLGGYVAMYQHLSDKQLVDKLLDGISIEDSLKRKDSLLEVPVEAAPAPEPTSRLSRLLRRDKSDSGASSQADSVRSLTPADPSPTPAADKDDKNDKNVSATSSTQAPSWWQQKKEAAKEKASSWSSMLKDKSSQYAAIVSAKSKELKESVAKSMAKSSEDKLYRGSEIRANFSLDDDDDDDDQDSATATPQDEHSLEANVRHALVKRTDSGQLIVDIDKVTASVGLGVVKHVFPCSEVEGQKMYPTWLLVTDVHVLKLREVQTTANRLYAHVVWRRALASILKISAKKKHPELLSFVFQELGADAALGNEVKQRFLVPQYEQAKMVFKERIEAIHQARQSDAPIAAEGGNGVAVETGSQGASQIDEKRPDEQTDQGPATNTSGALPTTGANVPSSSQVDSDAPQHALEHDLLGGFDANGKDQTPIAPAVDRAQPTIDDLDDLLA